MEADKKGTRKAVLVPLTLTAVTFVANDADAGKKRRYLGFPDPKPHAGAMLADAFEGGAEDVTTAGVYTKVNE